MFIAIKDTKVTAIHETEWQCRRKVKGLDKSDYWTWLATITTQDDDGHDVVTYPSEDFTIVECTDEDVSARLNQLGDYQAEGVYNITWSDSKVSAVTGQDMEGNDITIQTHFAGDDTARDARLLADKWKSIRLKRSRFLAETDYLAMKDQPDMSNDMQIYRKKLRDLPQDNSDPDNITWPSKPS